MYDRTGNYLILAILLGMILGVVAVAVLGEDALAFKFLGDIFLSLLKMVVIPLLFCSMIVGITRLGDVRKLGWTGGKTMLYFLATSSIAVAIGLILVNIVQPGSGFEIVLDNSQQPLPDPGQYSFWSWLTNQIPSNIVMAAAETKVLPIIVFALFFGSVLTTLGVRGKPVVSFFEGLNDVFIKFVQIIMWFAPIGIFGLVAGQLAAQGGLSGFYNVLTALGKYSFVVILGLLLHGLIVLPLILRFFSGKNPIEYFFGMTKALMTAFATSSSSATLPVTMDCVAENNNVDKRSSSFVLPLGATINMDGTALYEAVAALFIAQAYGIDLSIWAQITIFATAILASVGAAGIPQAGLFTMALVLSAVGLPLEGIGMILAIDWFLDRCRTTVNVWGDSIGAAVIANTSEIAHVDRSRRRAVPATRRVSTSRGRSSSTDSRSRRSQDEKGRRGSGRTTTSRTSRERTTTNRRDDNSKSQPGRTERSPRTRKAVATVDQPAVETREEYMPSGEQTPQTTLTGSRRSTKPDARPTTEQSKSSAGRDEKPDNEVRRRSRSRTGRSRGSERVTPKIEADQNGKSAATTESPATSDQQLRPMVSEIDYQVPKFPDKILENLALQDSTPEMNQPKEKNQETAPSKTEESESNGFARLDQVVLGQGKADQDDSAKEPKPDKSEPEVSVSDESEPVMSESDKSEPEETAEDKPSFIDDDVTDEKPEPELTGASADSNVPSSEEKPEEEVVPEEKEEADSATASTEDKIAENDGDDQPQWGRSKKRRIRR